MGFGTLTVLPGRKLWLAVVQRPEHGNLFGDKWMPPLPFDRRWQSIARSTRESGMTTSKKQASQAGKDLRDKRTPKRDRGPIASDLAQAKRKPKKRK